MPSPFSPFNPNTTSTTTLTNALLAANSGIFITSNSVILHASGQNAVNFYDGSLLPLGVSSGLLLTSGTTPGTSNTVGWFGTDNSATSGFNDGDADINAVVNTVFQTLSYDATTLSFDFTVADPNATSISFDIVFGSDEYPEWVDQFVDSAIVLVNGVNYALFNHDPNHPLSVVSANLAAGYFQNNANNILPIEYDGVSHVLKIVAPIQGNGATNHLKIGIADTGDHIYDSGIFIANLTAGSIPGSGVVTVHSPGSTTDSSDTVNGSAQDEYIDLKAGDDTCYAGAGDDIIVAGAGNDRVYGGSGNDQMKGDAGNDDLDGGDGMSDTAVYAGASNQYSIIYNSANNSYTVTTTVEGVDTLLNTELIQFSNGLFELTPSGLTSVGNPNTPPPNTSGSVIITGIGSVGNVLTATVNDPDGLSGAISYQWQISNDNGSSWTSIGTNSNTYTITATDVGNLIQVMANYTDGKGNGESPISASKSVLETQNGDLVVTLMQLTAPTGTSIINPLTTLVKDAIDLGLTPNLATNTIKTVLGIPASVSLQNYDAYAVLQSNPSNATALTVEKIAVQVAILTSLSDDDTGTNLTSAIIKAATTNKTLNLANANDLANILGLDITGITDKNLYPQPLKEIFDRNKTMADAIADGGNISDIEQEWQDLLSIQDGINSTSIADLSISVNQVPVGVATATLPSGVEGSPYTINSADLLLGFSDSDGDNLSVSDLFANINGSLTDNNNGTWTFTPDSNYSGPVELSYTVNDGQGGSIIANQLFVINSNTVNPSGILITGTSGNDNLVGGDGNDTLQGLAGKDSLDGGIGIDILEGGNGNDIYYVDDTGDVIVETTSGSTGGTDLVYASISYTLPNLVENLTLTGNGNINGTGNSANNTIIGNNGPNYLMGDTGNDKLDGKGGIDTLDGGAGNDTYTVDNINDVIIDSAGTDTVIASFSYTLATSLENLTLTGSANLNGTGNEGNNSIIGNTGANTLSGLDGNDNLNGGKGNDTLDGGTGNDTLIGGVGNDTLTGGKGSDFFRYNSRTEGIDTITDFNVLDDTFLVSRSGFSGGLVVGTLLDTQFTTGTSATTSAHRFIYNSTNGQLWYDIDGTGATTTTQIATLSAGLSLTASDFVVF